MSGKEKGSATATMDRPAPKAPAAKPIPTPHIGCIVRFWWQGNYGNPPAAAIVLKIEATGQVQVRDFDSLQTHRVTIWRGVEGERADNMRKAHGAWDYLEGEEARSDHFDRWTTEQMKREAAR